MKKMKKHFFLVERIWLHCFSWAGNLYAHPLLRKSYPICPLLITRAQTQISAVPCLLFTPHNVRSHFWGCPGACGSCSPLLLSQGDKAAAPGTCSCPCSARHTAYEARGNSARHPLPAAFSPSPGHAGCSDKSKLLASSCSESLSRCWLQSC